jgi:DNA-binding response OmpR family regulator
VSNRDAPFLLDALQNRIPLVGGRIALGRAADCDLVVADARVSRHHAELRREGDGFFLADLGSTNGTFLNGQRLTQALPLQDGDVIEVGSAQFVYHDPEATLDTDHFPHLVLDEASGQVWVDRQPVSLSARQHALLRLLWSRRGLPCSRDEITRAVWPECPEHIYDYQIESLVKRLRLKLEPDPVHPAVVLTVRGRGYRLSPLAFS